MIQYPLVSTYFYEDDKMIFPEIFPKTVIKFISGNADEVVSKIVHEIYPGYIHKLSWNRTAAMLGQQLHQGKICQIGQS